MNISQMTATQFKKPVSFGQTQNQTLQGSAFLQASTDKISLAQPKATPVMFGGFLDKVKDAVGVGSSADKIRRDAEKIRKKKEAEKEKAEEGGNGSSSNISKNRVDAMKTNGMLKKEFEAMSVDELKFEIQAISDNYNHNWEVLEKAQAKQADLEGQVLVMEEDLLALTDKADVAAMHEDIEAKTAELTKFTKKLEALMDNFETRCAEQATRKRLLEEVIEAKINSRKSSEPQEEAGASEGDELTEDWDDDDFSLK